MKEKLATFRAEIICIFSLVDSLEKLRRRNQEIEVVTSMGSGARKTWVIVPLTAVALGKGLNHFDLPSFILHLFF